MFTLPSDRATIWAPGVTRCPTSAHPTRANMAPVTTPPGWTGGIPHRTNIYQIVSPTGDLTGAADPTAINGALSSCPPHMVVQLTAGTYYLNTYASLIRDYLTLRGTVGTNGLPTTVFVKCAGLQTPVIVIGRHYASDKKLLMTGGNQRLSADAIPGTWSCRVSAIPTGLYVGEVVLVDERRDPSRSYYPAGHTERYNHRIDGDGVGRCISEWKQVTAIDAVNRIVTFNTPFHIGFRTAWQAELCRCGEGTQHYPATSWSGVEDIKVDNLPFRATTRNGNIWFERAAYSWLRNCESAYGWDHGMNIDGSFRCEIRDSFTHHNNPVSGGSGYNLAMQNGTSDSLFENSISWCGTKTITGSGAGGGNVIGYSFFDDNYIENAREFLESGLNFSHTATPHHTLFEGNQSYGFDTEEVHGNVIYSTVFRNQFTGWRLLANPDITGDGRIIGVKVCPHAWWHTFIGNFLGYEGMPVNKGTAVPVKTQWLLDKQEPNIASDSIAGWWTLGCNGSTGDWTTDSPELLAPAPVIRHGNYNVTVNGLGSGIEWTDPDHVLPTSLYLDSAPAFLGPTPWPPIQPENGVAYRIPARTRLDLILGQTAHQAVAMASGWVLVQTQTRSTIAYAGGHVQAVTLTVTSPTNGQTVSFPFDSTGTATPGATVTAYNDGTGAVVGTATATVGDWAMTINGTG